MHINDGEVGVQHLGAKNMAADGLTKNLQKGNHKEFCKLIVFGPRQW